MIPNRSILAVAVFILAISNLPAHAAIPFSPQDEVLSKRQFLAVVKQLIDSGNISNAESVSRILGLKFTHVDKVLEPKVAHCSAVKYPHNEYSNYREFSVRGATWYRVTPFGRKDVPILGTIAEIVQENLTTGHVVPKEQPAISYTVYRSRLCGNDRHEYTDARLDFNDLPAFLCLSDADVQAVIPAAEYERGIHVVTRYYKAPVSEEFAVDARFGPYGDGNQCIADIEINQNSARGLRFQRIHPWQPPQ